LLEIDIYPHTESASTRGLPNAVELTEEEIIATPREETNTPT
jgi:hypothetical protein